MIRLWCATVYVFSADAQQCLLLDHRKLGKWLPPGGKVDPNEIPDDAAVRETLEETGVAVKLLGERPEVTGGMIRPYGVQVNVVVPGEKEHIDLLYLATPIDSSVITVNAQEAHAVRWFPLDEIFDPTFRTCPSVRTWVAHLRNEMLTHFPSRSAHPSEQG